MTTDTAKIILGALLVKPDLLEANEDLTSGLFAGKDKEVFEAISDVWQEARPDTIDIRLVADKAKADLMAISGLLDHAMAHAVKPDSFKYMVAELAKEQLRKTIISKVDKAARAHSLDETIAEIRPLLHQYDLCGDKDKRLAEQVREWVEQYAVGEFSIRQIYSDLGVTSINGQANVRQVLARLVKNGLIDYTGRKTGWYRKVDRLAEPIDLMATQATPLDLYLPLGLGEQVNIYAKSIIVFAGSSNVGKTAVALDMVKGNMANRDVRYFFSEGGPEELRSRVELHRDLKIEAWTKMLAFEHSGHPADVISPDAVNVYDYMRVAGEGFFSIDDMLADVHKKLSKGIAFINIQKSKGRELGDGGEFSLRIPRLYVTLNPDPDRPFGADRQNVIARILKAKGWKNLAKNPEGKIMPFSITEGWQISRGTEWVYPETLCAAKTKRLY